ncbi:unnamed protein product [Ectocarpus sp. 12 AP-2014]
MIAKVTAVECVHTNRRREISVFRWRNFLFRRISVHYLVWVTRALSRISSTAPIGGVMSLCAYVRCVWSLQPQRNRGILPPAKIYYYSSTAHTGAIAQQGCAFNYCCIAYRVLLNKDLTYRSYRTRGVRLISKPKV